MILFKIWRNLLKFDSLHHYQYFILIFSSEKTWVDDFWPQFSRARYEMSERTYRITDKSVLREASKEKDFQMTNNIW